MLTMEDDLKLIEKKKTMMKTDNSVFKLILIIVLSSNISYDTTDVRRFIIHLFITFAVLFLIYQTVILNIIFVKFLSEEKIELKIWEGNLLINMVCLLIAVVISFFFVNNNLPHTYSLELYIIIPFILIYPIFRTYQKVSRIDLYNVL